MPKNQVHEGVLPLVDYDQVDQYLSLIGRFNSELIVAVFPPEPDKPCIHIPVNVCIPSHWGRWSVSWPGTRSTASASS